MGKEKSNNQDSSTKEHKTNSQHSTQTVKVQKDHGWFGTGVYATDNEDIAGIYAKIKRGDFAELEKRHEVDSYKHTTQRLGTTEKQRNLRQPAFTDLFRWLKDNSRERIDHIGWSASGVPLSRA